MIHQSTISMVLVQTFRRCFKAKSRKDGKRGKRGRKETREAEGRERKDWLIMEFGPLFRPPGWHRPPSNPYGGVLCNDVHVMYIQVHVEVHTRTSAHLQTCEYGTLNPLINQGST